jgi:hypothetical protein
MAVDTSDDVTKSGYQILYAGKQHFSQYRTLEMTPELFDHVQSRKIRWQQEHLYPTPYASSHCCTALV